MLSVHIILWRSYLQACLSKLPPAQILLQMIKAPFRFDIQYFSIVVIYSQQSCPSKYYFRDENEKNIYLASARKIGNLSSKDLKDIERQNFYFQTTTKPCLYLIVQNTETKEFYCSANKNDDLPLQIRAIFQSLGSLYSHIRNNCNGERIKMTKNGNIVIEYIIQDRIYRLKMENYPTDLDMENLEEFWSDTKICWENRKHPQCNDQLEGYYKKMQKGNISICGSISSQQNLSLKEKIEDISGDQVFQSNFQVSSKQRKNYAIPRKPLKPVKKRRRYRETSSEDQEEIDREQLLQKTKRYSRYSERQEMNYPTPKVKTIVKNYPQVVQQMSRRKKRDEQSKERKEKYVLSEIQKQGEQEAQNEYFARKQRMAEKPNIQLAQIYECLNKIRQEVGEIKKTSSESLEFEAVVGKIFQSKLALFMGALKKQIDQVNKNVSKVPEQIKKETFIEQIVDEENKKAYLQFYTEKMPLFRQNFSLSNPALMEDYLKKLWTQLSFSQKNDYYLKVKNGFIIPKKRGKKSGKDSSFKIIDEKSGLQEIIANSSSEQLLNRKVMEGRFEEAKFVYPEKVESHDDFDEMGGQNVQSK